MDSAKVQAVRERMSAAGLPVDNVPDEHIREMLHQRALDFREKAPMTAADAATVILDGVRDGRWRILVGEDAHALDKMVRKDPESAYEPDFIERLYAAGHFGGLPSTGQKLS